jgi:hypothetical protein
LYGEIQMATTTFSGPVVSDNGFTGDATGNVVATTLVVSQAQTGLAAKLVDEDNALNTTGKVAGLQIVDLDDGLIYTASGAGVNDDWLASDGTTSVTPA